MELEMKSSKRKANASRSNVSTSASEEEENHSWELVEDLELKVSELKDQKVELEESVKTLESDLKSMKEAGWFGLQEWNECFQWILIWKSIWCHLKVRILFSKTEPSSLGISKV